MLDNYVMDAFIALSELVLGLRDLWWSALSFNEINAIAKACCQRLSKQWFYSLIAPEIVFQGYFFWFSYPNCSIDKIMFHMWREFQCHTWCQVITNKWRRPQVNPTNTHSGPRLNIKTVSSTYGDFHVKDKTAVRTSYLQHGNCHTW